MTELETRYQRIAREQAERQAARAEKMRAQPRKKQKNARNCDDRHGWTPQTDPLDEGDNLGESPDY